MSIFPTKILLATDGSKEAELASRTAAELSQSTSAELHVLYVGEPPNPYAEGWGLWRTIERPAQSLTRRQKRCGRAAGRWHKLT